MANHKSEIKRAKQNINRNLRNRSTKTRIKTAIKAVRNSVSNSALENSAQELNEAKSIIARAAQKGVIHPRNASRRISRLTKLINRASQA